MRRVFLAIAVALVFGAGGCGEDKVLSPFPPARIYPQPLNPASVMDALRIAYGRRDTTEIKLLYDDAYQGTSIDQTDPVPASLNFTKADEVSHVSALAHDASLLHVSLILSNNMIRFSDLADPPGWATIQNPVLSVEVSSASASHQVDATQESMEFKFVPHTPDATSQTDTTWKIVRWTEVKN